MRLTEQLLIYIGVGAVGTLAHYAVTLTMVEFLERGPVIGSSAGFVVGATINYYLNARYTFKTNVGQLATFARFFTVACIGLLLNALTMALVIKAASIHYMIAQLVATGVVVLVTFFTNRVWTFRLRDNVAQK